MCLSFLYVADLGSDGIIAVLSGRLRTSTRDVHGARTLGKEYARGEVIGQLELITGQKRTTTLHAIRPSEIVQIQLASYQYLSAAYPHVGTQISRLLAKSAAGLLERESQMEKQKNRSFHTIALLPLSGDIPLEDFAYQFAQAMVDLGLETADSMTILTSSVIRELLGPNVLDRRGETRLQGYLGYLEERTDLILFVADSNANSIWTETCINHVSELKSSHILNNHI